MTIQVKHGTLLGGANDSGSPVSKNVWNEAHNLTGAPGKVVYFDGLGNAAEGDDSNIPYTPSGASAAARSLQTKLREGRTSLADHTTITAAVAASALLFVPAGAHALAADVTMPGALSWRMAPGASFTGVGQLLTSPDLLGFNHTADLRKIQLVEAAGTAAAPLTHHQPVALFSKHINFPDDGTGKQPAAVVCQAYKWSTLADAHVQSIFGEAIDRSGGSGAFVEGARFHGISMLGASSGRAYGVLGYAQADSGAEVICAFEGETRRVTGADSPAPLSYAGSKLDTPFLATLRGGKVAMAGFTFNPHSETQARCGFLVANSLNAQGVNRGLITFAAFATIEADVPHGFFANGCTYSVLRGPNNVPIRMLNAAGNAEHDVLNYLTDNTIAVGTEAVAIRLPKPVIFTPGNTVNPATAGQLVIQTTSNTVLTFKYQGSDNVVRSATLALA